MIQVLGGEEGESNKVGIALTCNLRTCHVHVLFSTSLFYFISLIFYFLKFLPHGFHKFDISSRYFALLLY